MAAGTVLTATNHVATAAVSTLVEIERDIGQEM